MIPPLFRDVGPDGIRDFLEDALNRLGGPAAEVVYLRTAEVPCPTRAGEEFGELIFLQPRSLEPRPAPEPGIYVARADAQAVPGSIGWVPPGTDRRTLSRAAEAMRTEAELREHLGDAYEEGKERMRRTVREYQEERSVVEGIAARLRENLGEFRQDLERAGLRESDLIGPWFEFDPARRRRILDTLIHFSLR